MHNHGIFKAGFLVQEAHHDIMYQFTGIINKRRKAPICDIYQYTMVKKLFHVRPFLLNGRWNSIHKTQYNFVLHDFFVAIMANKDAVECHSQGYQDIA